VIALLLGDRLMVAGIGQVCAVILPDKGPPERILSCTGSPSDPEEAQRVRDAHAVIRAGTLFNHVEGPEQACRILAAKHVFDVLQIDPGGPSDDKQVRSAYRKLALQVHPDKQGAGANLDDCKAAFARLDSAKEAVESMLAEDSDSCREIHRILRSEVHTRSGAASLLSVDKAATVDTDSVAEDADRAAKELVKKISRMKGVCSEYDQAVACCREAVETIRRGCTPEALPRQEALLREGVLSTRAMGARDLRSPFPIVLIRAETSKYTLPSNVKCRLALLCGATAALDNDSLVKASASFERQPKASALRWCLSADSAAACCSAVCVRLETSLIESLPPAKRMKSGGIGPDGTVRIRHILFKHKQLKQPDLMARRIGSAATVQEAEESALGVLDKLLKEPAQFLRLCRELSDCESASQPGQLAGDLGWVGRGQHEQAFEDVSFGLRPNDFGDLVTTSRGVHVIQRLA